MEGVGFGKFALIKENDDKVLSVVPRDKHLLSCIPVYIGQEDRISKERKGRKESLQVLYTYTKASARTMRKTAEWQDNTRAISWD